MRGICARLVGAGLALAAVLCSPLAPIRPARADGTFIAAANRTDFVHDTRRGKIYVSNGNQIIIYDVATGQSWNYNEFSGRITGNLDISPDGQTLAVALTGAPGTASTYARPPFALIDLNTFQERPLSGATNSIYGANSVAFDNAGTLFVNVREEYGYGTTFCYNLTTGEWKRTPVNGSAPLFVTTPDHERVGFATRGTSPGDWGYINPQTGASVALNSWSDGGGFNYELGLSADGKQFAVPRYGSFNIYNDQGTRLASLGGYNPNVSGINAAMGVAYDPKNARFFAPWCDTNQVRIFDSLSFAQIGAYNFETIFGWQGNASMTKGHTRVSDDGSLLMVSVDGGVRWVRLADASSNKPLRFVGASYTSLEDESFSFAPKAIDGSPNYTNAFSVDIAPRNGTLTPGDNGTWTYRPKRDFNGADSAHFAVKQGDFAASGGWVYFTVTPVNDAPVLSTDGAVAKGRKGGTATLNNYSIYDVDDVGVTFPSYSVRVVRAPLHGTIEQGFGEFVYRAAADFSGLDSFDIVANDARPNANPPVAGLDSNVVTLSINVADNAPPVARDDAYYNVPLDRTFRAPAPGVLANDTDPEGDSITAAGAGYVSWGSASVSGNGAIEWSPWFGQFAYDSQIRITYYAKDALGGGNVATITLYSGPPTLANSQTLSTPTGAVLPITLSGSGSGVLNYRITRQPAHGALRSGGAGNGALWNYAPTTGYIGGDNFEFEAQSSSGATGVGTVLIRVTEPINGAPTAPDQSVSGFEDTPFSFALQASDPDGDALIYTITQRPAHGSIDPAGGRIYYRAFDDYNGEDQLKYKVSDGRLESREATVSIHIEPVSDTPVARADSYQTAEDTPLSVPAPGVLINDTDADGDALTARAVTQPSHGTLQLRADGGFDYAPDADWNGDDSFSYAAFDGVLTSVAATVTIRVTPVDDAPIANGDALEGALEDTPFFIADSALTANDFDPDGALDNPQIEIVTAPAHGLLGRGAGGFTYAPNLDFNGADSFVYRLKSGALWSQNATVTLQIAPVNDAPVAADASFDGVEDMPLGFKLAASDADGDALTFEIVGAPAHGAVKLSGAAVIYTPALDYNGEDSLTFRAADGQLSSQIATITLHIAPVNDAPRALAQSVSTPINIAKAITLAGTDVEGDALTFAVLNFPLHGKISGAGASLLYTPTTGYSGADSFTFRANDGALWSTPATVTIDVMAPPPVATARSLTLLEDKTVVVLLAGAASGGATITEWSVVDVPLHGTLSGGGNARTYAPAADYFGTDSFTFRVRDSRGNWSQSATISLQITPVNDAPSFNIVASASAAKNAPTQIIANAASAITAGPANESGQILSFTCTNSNSKLFAVQPQISPNGTLTFQPKKGATGTATVTVKLTDSGGTASGGVNVSQPKTLVIRVN